jgi:cytidyltransferase-like protein
MDLIEGRVMVFGTYDVWHPGHNFFIEEALKRGVTEDSELIVIIARDRTVKMLKPNLRNSEDFRLKIVQEAFPEATVVLGDKEDYMIPIRKYKPALVCLGYDQNSFSAQLMVDFPEIEIERIEAFHPEKYKSSKM